MLGIGPMLNVYKGSAFLLYYLSKFMVDIPMPTHLIGNNREENDLGWVIQALSVKCSGMNLEHIRLFIHRMRAIHIIPVVCKTPRSGTWGKVEKNLTTVPSSQAFLIL